MTVFFQLFKKIFKDSLLKSRLSRVLLFALVLNLTFGGLFFLVERGAQPDLTLIDAVWWAMVTMTTVGYGDFFAQTAVGRFCISYPCMLIGIGFIGYLVGVIAENMLDRFSRKKRGLMGVTLHNHLIICNFPSLEKVQRLIEELQCSYEYKDTKFVLLTNEIEELPEELSSLGVQFVYGSPLREGALLKANVTECCGVFVLARDPKKSASDSETFATGTIIEMIEREFDHPIKVVVELVSKENHKMMRRSNVDGIVSADGVMDGLMVQEFLYPGVHDIVHQILTNAVGSQFYIYKTRLTGFKISDIQLAVMKHPANLQVIGINRDGQSILNPSKTEEIQQQDRLIILADKRSDFESIEEEILQQ